MIVPNFTLVQLDSLAKRKRSKEIFKAILENLEVLRTRFDLNYEDIFKLADDAEGDHNIQAFMKYYDTPGLSKFSKDQILQFASRRRGYEHIRLMSNHAETFFNMGLSLPIIFELGTFRDFLEIVEVILEKFPDLINQKYNPHDLYAVVRQTKGTEKIISLAKGEFLPTVHAEELLKALASFLDINASNTSVKNIIVTENFLLHKLRQLKFGPGVKIKQEKINHRLYKYELTLLDKNQLRSWFLKNGRVFPNHMENNLAPGIAQSSPEIKNDGALETHNPVLFFNQTNLKRGTSSRENLNLTSPPFKLQKYATAFCEVMYSEEYSSTYGPF